eukprot:2417479-Rhodomonas_salina.1
MARYQTHSRAEANAAKRKRKRKRKSAYAPAGQIAWDSEACGLFGFAPRGLFVPFWGPQRWDESMAARGCTRSSMTRTVQRP